MFAVGRVRFVAAFHRRAPAVRDRRRGGVHELVDAIGAAGRDDVVGAGDVGGKIGSLAAPLPRFRRVVQHRVDAGAGALHGGRIGEIAQALLDAEFVERGRAPSLEADRRIAACKQSAA